MESQEELAQAASQSPRTLALQLHILNLEKVSLEVRATEKHDPSTAHSSF
jgi:hypothetical protein